MAEESLINSKCAIRSPVARRFASLDSDCKEHLHRLCLISHRQSIASKGAKGGDGEGWVEVRGIWKVALYIVSFMHAAPGERAQGEGSS